MMMSSNDFPSCRLSREVRVLRSGFTLVELLVTISIIALLASFVLVGLAGVQESARADATRAQIAKLDSLIGEKWESFRTRRLPLVVPPALMTNSSPNVINEREMMRVEAIRRLMVQELPERKSDVVNFLPPNQPPSSSLWLAYRRAARRHLIKKHRLNENSTPRAETPQFSNVLNQHWSIEQESAECLYLIVSQIIEDDQSALEFFPERERTDVDNDGMPEIADAWGTPIRFLRWAPGITPPEPLPPGIAGTPQDAETPDPLNPRQLYRDPNGNVFVSQNRVLFALYPLIVSFGSDKDGDIVFGYNGVTLPPLDPYASYSQSTPMGTHADVNGDGKFGFLDNISNHSLYAQ